MIHGPDVSSWTGDVRWDEVRAVSEFAIVKVTEGNSYVNPRAAVQVEGALKAGLLVMLFHYAKPDGPNWEEDAAAEAERLDKIADAFEAKYGKKFFCFLDIERNEPLSDFEKAHWRDWCNAFRRRCRELGRAVGFYSYRPFTAQLQLDASWENTLLWAASYPIPFSPTHAYPWPDGFLPWARVDIHQHGGDGNKARWPGIEGFADVNTFAGTLDELIELIDNAA
jgi:GH25 family lysozyme M1 (1,4-beta-N-acetylmuramidase)